MSYYVGYANADREQNVPGGGAAGDVLTLDANLSMEWAAPASGGGSGSGDVNFLELVTGFTGGGSTNLDGVATTAITVPALYWFKHATLGGRGYVLRAGTDAEASPGIIRPDDYNGATNAKVWQAFL